MFQHLSRSGREVAMGEGIPWDPPVWYWYFRGAHCGCWILIGYWMMLYFIMWLDFLGYWWILDVFCVSLGLNFILYFHINSYVFWMLKNVLLDGTWCIGSPQGGLLRTTAPARQGGLTLERVPRSIILWMVAKSPVDRWFILHQLIGFQHVSTILLVVQDFFHPLYFHTFPFWIWYMFFGILCAHVYPILRLR